MMKKKIKEQSIREESLRTIRIFKFIILLYIINIKKRKSKQK